MALGLALAANAVGYFANADAIQGNKKSLKEATRALCTQRQEYIRAADDTKLFLLTHPGGIPGVPNALLIRSERINLQNAKALSDVKCPKPQPKPTPAP